MRRQPAKPRRGASVSKLSPNQRVADTYVCEQLMATGGMAEIWSVRHVALGTPFVLKTPTSRAADVVAMFDREAHILARVSHRNVVQLLDYANLPDGSPFLVMEWVRGPSVLDLLDQLGRLPWRRAVALVRQLLDALGAVHACGFVHRDVKPANLVVAEDSPERLRLIDFGIACPTRQARPRGRSAVVAGTPGFMAPEVMAGEPSDERSDLFAVGAVLAAMIHGRSNQMPATAVEPLGSRRQKPAARVDSSDTPPPVPAEVPPAVHACIAALMHIDPAQRPPNCVDALRLLQGLIHALESSRTPSSEHRSPRPLSGPGAVPPERAGGGKP